MEVGEGLRVEIVLQIAGLVADGEAIGRIPFGPIQQDAGQIRRVAVQGVVDADDILPDRGGVQRVETRHDDEAEHRIDERNGDQRADDRSGQDLVSERSPHPLHHAPPI